MDAMTKNMFKSQLAGLSAANQHFKSIMGVSPAPVLAGVPPAPVLIQAAIGPHLNALKQHADEFEKLIKLLGEIVDKL
jgi:hypothetical protein